MRTAAECKDNADERPLLVKRGTLREYWLFFAAGIVLNIIPFLGALALRKSFAAKRGSLAGCGLSSMTIVVLIGAAVWARADFSIPLVQLALLVFFAILGPIAVSVGSEGFARLKGRRWSIDFALGVVSALLSFGVLIGACVVMLIRGLWTST